MKKECLLVCAFLWLLLLPAFAQQEDINRYAVFTGFDYMVSPSRNLTERGFDTDFGVVVKPWLGLGGDFSAIGDKVLSGAGTIKGSDTALAPLLTAAAPIGAPPPGAVQVPFTSTTYTFAAGPQFYLRKSALLTLFARPGFGGIHETANLYFPPAIAGVLTSLGAPVPATHQSDTTIFFGLGGGFDLNVSRPVGVRFAVDWVNTHLFSNLLPDRQNYVRFSIGPTFRWGNLWR
jgi:hypothetical protein